MNTIRRLKNNAGSWVDNGNQLNALILNYFQSLFTSSECDITPVIQSIESIISEAQNLILNRKFEGEEVRKALFEMKHDKSPGLDGFTPGFY